MPLVCPDGIHLHAAVLESDAGTAYLLVRSVADGPDLAAVMDTLQPA